jgi:hypothetical protein
LRALQKTYPMISNMGGQGGTQTSTSEQSPWKTAAGLGMAGLGAMSGMGMFGGMGGMMGGMGQYGAMPWLNAGGSGGIGWRGGYASPTQRA